MILKAIHNDEIHKLSGLQPDGWVDIVPQFDFYTKSSFCFPVKVEMDDEIIGVGVTIVHSDVAWLAHIIVHPDYRCRGIGQLITQSLIDIAENHKCSTIYLVATELGEFVYRKKGFSIETEYHVYKNVTKQDWQISSIIRPYQGEFKKHFVTFDKNISGEDRMMHLEKYLANSLVYHNHDNIEGYYLPTLGEGLIIADSENAGIELLKLHLSSNNGVVIPKENIVARAFLQEIGFEEIKIIHRMRLGENRTVLFSNIYNRIGGKIG